jgi:hypothetical protein
VSTVTSDLSGGLPDAMDLCVVDPPDDDPFYGENHALWLWDDEHSIGVHTYLKTIGHVTSFRHRRESIFVYLPDGSILTSDEDGPGPTDPAVVRGPNLVLECLEPFRRWRFSYDCTALRSDAERMRVGLLCVEPPEALAFDLEVTMAKPPWMYGTYTTGPSLDWVKQFGTGGGPSAQDPAGMRYEQLMTATGTVQTKDGPVEVTGAGMRTHRLGYRNTGTFPGHSWSTALWSDGRGFGFTKMCGADGVSRFEEAWVSDGGERHAAEIVSCPLFTQKLPGEEFDIELSSALGRASIHGQVTATNFVTLKQPDTQKHCPGADRSDGSNRIMTQALARYLWDGDVGQGMIERSLRVEDMGADPANFRTG